MNDEHFESRFVVGQAPVNRRTAAPARADAPAGGATPPAALSGRLRQLQARHALGPGLAERLAAPTAAAVGVSGRAVALAVAGTGLALGAALLPGLLWTAAAGLGALGCLAGAGLHLRRGAAEAAAAAGPAARLADPATLQALDRLAEAATAELQPASVAALVACRDRLVAALQAQAAAAAEGGSPPEDALYLRECLRRYLPDSLEAFLRVPAAQRATPLEPGGASAERLLQDQLAELGAALAALEARAAQVAGQGLRRQRDFLRAKGRPGG